MVTGEMKPDIEFWPYYFPDFNGCVVQVSHARPPVTVFCDSSSVACGAVLCGGDYFFHPWSRHELVALSHINFKECATFTVAAERYASSWTGKKVTFVTDNVAACGMLRKGSSGDPVTMGKLRELFWLRVKHNFKIEVMWTPGISQLADPASRLNEPGMEAKLQTLFSLLCYFRDLLRLLPDERSRAMFSALHVPYSYLPRNTLRLAGFQLTG